MKSLVLVFVTLLATGCASTNANGQRHLASTRIVCSPDIKPTYHAQPPMGGEDGRGGSGSYFCRIPASACTVIDGNNNSLPAQEEIRCLPAGSHRCPSVIDCVKNNGGKDGNWHHRMGQPLPYDDEGNVRQ